MLVEFASAVDAARCAVEVQRGVTGQNIDVPVDGRIEFRIGIHVGDIIFDDNDIFGDGVNIATRLEGIAEPGGVCISDDAQRQIRGKVDIAFEDMGPQNLKNIAEPMRAWRLRIEAKSPALHSPNASIADATKPLPLPDKPSIAVLPPEYVRRSRAASERSGLWTHCSQSYLPKSRRVSSLTGTGPKGWSRCRRAPSGMTIDTEHRAASGRVPYQPCIWQRVVGFPSRA
jgi:hypothetical protein